MEGIVYRRKRYVEVVSVTDAEGNVTPCEIHWDDGRRFTIERITDKRKDRSRLVQGFGVRYVVVINGQKARLFYENPRWFVEEKVVELPD